jgi:hypothetical protein
MTGTDGEQQQDCRQQNDLGGCNEAHDGNSRKL